jgi:hypothetical protein
LSGAKEIPAHVLAPSVEQASPAVPTAEGQAEDAAAVGTEEVAVAETVAPHQESMEVDGVDNSPLPAAVANVSDTAEVTGAVSDASPAKEVSATAPVVLVEVTVADRARMHVVALVKAYVVRMIQGSSAALRDTVAAVRSELQIVHDEIVKMEAAPVTADGGTEVNSKQLVLDAVERLLDSVVLAEEVKSLAVRQCYGNRSEKSLMFDCTDALAVWRWEAHSMQHFTKSAQAVLREARTVRGRYSRALKAAQRVLEQLQKLPHSEIKLAPLEERFAKCLQDVEKAKEKRREVEAKRAADSAERRRKEEAREQKRAEKEEAERTRKATAEASAAAKASLAPANAEKEKKAPIVSEKAQKKALELEKSKNVFMNFLKSSSAPAAATTAGAAPAASSSAGAVGVSSSTAIPTAATPVEDETERLARFEAAMQSEMSVSEIMTCQRRRYSDLASRRAGSKSFTARRRRYVDLHVAVIVPDPRARQGTFDAGDNTYSEIQEKRFHNKVRTLSFWEDHRPAYVGTVSRKSGVICGRRPLAKDTELLNYEYDSEEDWEEEVEGEDLNDTDEEEEDGANELEYDDFFCRDDDFGSDAEGDVDPNVALRVAAHRKTIEVFGPRFIDPARLPPAVVEVRQAEATEENNTAPQKPTIHLRRAEEPISTFSIFDLSTGELLSQSNAKASDADANNLSSYAAVSYAQFPAPVLGVFDAPVPVGSKKTHSAGAPHAGATASTDVATDAKAAHKHFDEAVMPELAKFVHGKKDGIDKLVLAFHALHPTFSKLQIQKRIKDLADKARHADGHGTSRFMVKPEMLEKLQIKVSRICCTAVRCGAGCCINGTGLSTTRSPVAIHTMIS